MDDGAGVLADIHCLFFFFFFQFCFPEERGLGKSRWQVSACCLLIRQRRSSSQWFGAKPASLSSWIHTATTLGDCEQASKGWVTNDAGVGLGPARA